MSSAPDAGSHRPGSRVTEAWRAAGIMGVSPCFLETLELVARFAGSEVPLLILGETGTGKELIARAAHYLSQRSGGPFIAVNCAGLPERLFENELFGHGRGAFTDARDSQPGLVVHAEGGTLLLDEVDSLDLHSQAALLRFLQDQQYRPLGAGHSVQAHVRVIAASNASLEEQVARGAFRSDLLFRLDVARVELPPLRQRRADILLLGRHFLEILAARLDVCVPELAPEAEQTMLAWSWPGNVRELENAMYRAILLADGGRLIHDLPWIAGRAGARPAPDMDIPIVFAGSLKAERARVNNEFERKYLIYLLERAHGNITAASREAGTERRHFGRMLQRHGIDAEPFRR